MDNETTVIQEEEEDDLYGGIIYKTTPKPSIKPTTTTVKPPIQQKVNDVSSPSQKSIPTILAPQTSVESPTMNTEIQDKQDAEIEKNIELVEPNLNKTKVPSGKMFVGGLSWQTTDDTLRKYMSLFGELEDCLVMKDPLTNRSRGFAFLTFKDPLSIDKLLKTDHYIDGKKIDAKRAVPKDEYEKAEKVFVGGVPLDVSDEQFKEFFMEYGKVNDATLMYDRETGRMRGFGFVTFARIILYEEIHFFNPTNIEWNSVQKMLDQQASNGIYLSGKRIEIKPASLRNQPTPMNGYPPHNASPPNNGYYPPQPPYYGLGPHSYVQGPGGMYYPPPPNNQGYYGMQDYRYSPSPNNYPPQNSKNSSRHGSGEEGSSPVDEFGRFHPYSRSRGNHDNHDNKSE